MQSTKGVLVRHKPADGVVQAIFVVSTLLFLPVLQQAKNDALAAAGAIVPDSFEGLETAVRQTFQR